MLSIIFGGNSFVFPSFRDNSYTCIYMSISPYNAKLFQYKVSYVIWRTLNPSSEQYYFIGILYL